MLTKMTKADWEIVLEVFDAAQSERGEPGQRAAGQRGIGTQNGAQ